MILRIKEVIKEQGVTAISIAKRIGITQPAMSNIVTNKSSPSLETLKKMADLLGVSVTDFFEKPKKGSFSCPHCNKEINIETS